MKFLDRLLFRKPAPLIAFDTPLAPAHPVYVIGDIHGCDHLLAELLDAILAERPEETGARIVFVGDYVDRGENSAAVLRRVFDLSRNSPVPVHCLMGNHEDMMLKFIENPAERSERWLKFGGLQTLASFGVGGVTTTSSPDDAGYARDCLVEAMGQPLLQWIAALPVAYQTGNVAVVHAGADPALGMADQQRRVLTWGHRDFLRVNRRDGIWVVHGHTIVDQPGAVSGRIATDTGAYATGVLTAAVISAGSVRYLQARGGYSA